jgi:hypothetical protein
VWNLRVEIPRRSASCIERRGEPERGRTCSEPRLYDIYPLSRRRRSKVRSREQIVLIPRRRPVERQGLHVGVRIIVVGIIQLGQSCPRDTRNGVDLCRRGGIHRAEPGIRDSSTLSARAGSDGVGPTRAGSGAARLGGDGGCVAAAWIVGDRLGGVGHGCG